MVPWAHGMMFLQDKLFKFNYHPHPLEQLPYIFTNGVKNEWDFVHDKQLKSKSKKFIESSKISSS
jgi:hypothetical protein